MGKAPEFRLADSDLLSTVADVFNDFDFDEWQINRIKWLFIVFLVCLLGLVS